MDLVVDPKLKRIVIVSCHETPRHRVVVVVCANENIHYTSHRQNLQVFGS